VSMLQAAIDLAELGIPVFSLAALSKLPNKGTDGVKAATCDIDTIRKMWVANPGSNIGIGLGHEYEGWFLVGVDLDHNHGATESDLARFPDTVTAKTKNGYHLYFRSERLVPSHALWGGTTNTAPAYLRSFGYYVVAPPSIVRHRDNDGNATGDHQYHFLLGKSFTERKLADLPEWAYEGSAGVVLPTGARDSGSSPPAEDEGVAYGPGERHDMFVRTAVAMRSRGKPPEAILERLQERDQKDVTKPKNDPKELANLVAWAQQKVSCVAEKINTVTPEDDDWILPLGYADGHFFYTSSSNKEIVPLTAGGHTPYSLLSLMPLDYWESIAAKKTREGQAVDWPVIVSALMHLCLDKPPFRVKNIRGSGCWDDGGRLVIHAGTKLYSDGKEYDLAKFPDSKYCYTRRFDYDYDPCLQPLSLDECKPLLEVTTRWNWHKPVEGKLFVGGLALMRVSGALRWRPHLWVTGAASSGKTTLVRDVAAVIAGDDDDARCFTQGGNTAAGIRQRMKADSLPIIFDEAEAEGRRGQQAMEGVIELARQASSDGDAMILKGTQDGRGISYKASSMYVLSSTVVHLVRETDRSRFCVLNLGGVAKDNSRELDQWLRTNITRELSDRLMQRVISRFQQLRDNIALFRDAVATVGSARNADQYGTLLAGYWMLMSDTAPTTQEAGALVAELDADSMAEETAGREPEDALNHLCDSQIEYEYERMLGEKVRVKESVGAAVERALADPAVARAILDQGIKISHKTGHVYVAYEHEAIKKLYLSSRWPVGFGQQLARLPGAGNQKQKMRLNRTRAVVSIPLLHFGTETN
jgi:hypothetical protein